MKKTALIFFMLYFVAFTANSQVRMEKSRIYDGPNLLKPKQALELMRPDPEAFAAFKKAKSNYDAAQVLGFAGGFLVGWSLGTALGGGEPQWGLTGIGAALIVTSIPLQVGYKKNAQKAIDLYNRNGSSRVPDLRFRLKGNGASLSLFF